MTTTTVTTGALVKRINRKLAREGQRLSKTRGQRARVELGDYLVTDLHTGNLVCYRVDPEALARELGVLGPGD